MRARTWLLLTLMFPSAALAQGGFNGPGRYEITNLKSGKILSLDRNGQTGVIQFSSQNSDNQAWDIQPASGGVYYFRNGMNGNALEAPGNRNSMLLRATPFHGGPSQQWRIESGKDGNALIVSSNGKTLDVPDGSDRDGLPIQIYDLNGDSNQRFLLRRVTRGFFGRAPAMGSGQSLQCASDDGRRHYCQADTRGGVRLTRQISGSPCRENETWGYDSNGVWVDRGCRAEFTTGSPVSRAPVTSSVVRCSSDDGRRHSCQADTRFGVRLTRQISGSPCRENETWGYDRNGIWVDRGCRAEFEVGRR